MKWWREYKAIQRRHREVAEKQAQATAEMAHQLQRVLKALDTQGEKAALAMAQIAEDRARVARALEMQNEGVERLRRLLAQGQEQGVVVAGRVAQALETLVGQVAPTGGTSFRAGYTEANPTGYEGEVLDTDDVRLRMAEEAIRAAYKAGAPPPRTNGEEAPPQTWTPDLIPDDAKG